MNEHVSGEILAAYVDDRLEKGQRPGVEAHLSRCRECRQALADVAGMLANRENPPAEFLRQGLKACPAVAAGHRDAPRRRPLLPRPAFGVAAVFLVAVIAGFFFLGRGRVELPRSNERGMAGQLAAKGEAAEPGRDEAAPAIAAAPEMAGRGRSRAASPGQAAGPGLKKKLAAETPGSVPPPPAALPEATPSAQPVDRDPSRQADKAEPTRYDEMEEGMSGGALGDVEAPAEEVRAGEMKAAFAQKALPRPAGNGSSVAASRRSHSTVLLGATAGALQVFLATSGRASAPLNLAIVELAAGPLVRIEGDVTRDDLLAPGLQDIGAWLPEGSELRVTIGADGRVTAVDLFGDWDPAAAMRAKKAAGRLVFTPARQETRRAILSRDLLSGW